MLFVGSSGDGRGDLWECQSRAQGQTEARNCGGRPDAGIGMDRRFDVGIPGWR